MNYCSQWIRAWHLNTKFFLHSIRLSDLRHKCRYTWTASPYDCSFVYLVWLFLFHLVFDSLSVAFKKNTIKPSIFWVFWYVFWVLAIGFFNNFNDVCIFALLLNEPCHDTVGCKGHTPAFRFKKNNPSRRNCCAKKKSILEPYDGISILSVAANINISIIYSSLILTRWISKWMKMESGKKSIKRTSSQWFWMTQWNPTIVKFTQIVF